MLWYRLRYDVRNEFQYWRTNFLHYWAESSKSQVQKDKKLEFTSPEQNRVLLWKYYWADATFVTCGTQGQILKMNIYVTEFILGLNRLMQASNNVRNPCCVIKQCILKAANRRVWRCSISRKQRWEQVVVVLLLLLNRNNNYLILLSFIFKATSLAFKKRILVCLAKSYRKNYVIHHKHMFF